MSLQALKVALTMKLMPKLREDEDSTSIPSDVVKAQDSNHMDTALVHFRGPGPLPAEHAKFISDLVVLDQRSRYALGRSARRAEVKALLVNALTTAGYEVGNEASPEGPKVKPIAPAAAFLEHAAKTFARHVESRNRSVYLAGVLTGIVMLVVVASWVESLLPTSVQSAFSDQIMPSLIWFAGLGSIVSVLMRLSRLEVANEVSDRMLVISGVGRPVVASALALVVYLVIANKLVSVALVSDKVTVGTHFVVAFLCGFSERFAEDVISRVDIVRKRDKSDPPAVPV